MSTIPTEFLPDFIEVDVRAYDKSEWELFHSSPHRDYFKLILSNYENSKIIKIPKEQFIVYSMFQDRDVSTWEALHQDVLSQERKLKRLLKSSYNNGINLKDEMIFAEHASDASVLGEALALNTSDEIFGTIENDWRRIPKSNKKTLDAIGTSTNGKLRIEIEAKGSFLEDSWIVSPSVSDHKRSIKNKKAHLASVASDCIRIGAIAMVGKNVQHRPVVRLVDPPVDEETRDPLTLQLLTRLRFISHWISTISPRSSLAIALKQRLVDLNSIQDINQLDKVPLVDGSGEEIDVTPLSINSIHSRFFQSHSVISDGPTGGIVFPAGDGLLFFVGMMGEVLDLAQKQSFSNIRTYRRTPVTVEKTVNCVFPRGRFQRHNFSMTSTAIRNSTRNQNYIRLDAKGTIHYTAAGLAYGWLHRPNDL